MEILIILFLVILNGIFAMAEIALVSSKKVRLEEKAKKGSKGAKIALQFMQKPEEFLSTVQVGITLVGIIAGALGGTTLAEDLTPLIERIEPVKELAFEISFIIVVGFITYLSLIIGELVPKTIAYNNPEGISIALAPLMKVLSIIAHPVVRFLSFSTKIFLAILGIESKKAPPLTEDELKSLIEQGSQFGTIEKKENEMIKSIFRFGDRKAYSIMIPRQDVLWLDINDPPEVIRETIYNSNYSRLLLCNGTLDEIIGILRVKDFFRHNEKGKELNLRSIAAQPLFIPDNLPALKILERFRESKIHTAIVVDEYGSTEGIITLHDLIENIFGELPDRHEKPELSIVVREDGSMLIDGSILFDELREKLNLHFENSDVYTTLGGFVMYKLNKIPQEGDKFNSGEYKFEVVDMDGKRVDKVLVQKRNT
ncbi:MAG TPA: hemolysin family protein [Ignavibacteriaceae bacterium]|jgi:putative hemolysin